MRDNREKIAEFRQVFAERIQVDKLVKARVFDLATDLSAKEIRKHLGVRFRTQDLFEHRKKKGIVADEPTASSARSVSAKRSLEDFFGESTTSASSSFHKSPESKLFVACSLAHAAYDLYFCMNDDEQHYQTTVAEIRAEYITELSRQDFEDFLHWLPRPTKRCRYSYWFSDMTKHVLQEIKSLGPTQEANTFLFLVYTIANNRSYLPCWRKCCKLTGLDLETTVATALDGVHLINFHSLPVSSATGCKGSLYGLSSSQILRKVVKLGCAYITDLELSAMTDWRQIKKTISCSDLQAMILCRCWCRAFELQPAAKEIWTDKSRPSVPKAYQQRDVRMFALHLRDLASGTDVGRKIMGMSQEHGTVMYCDDHVEHCACEIRKFRSSLRKKTPKSKIIKRIKKTK